MSFDDATRPGAVAAARVVIQGEIAALLGLQDGRGQTADDDGEIAHNTTGGLSSTLARRPSGSYAGFDVAGHPTAWGRVVGRAYLTKSLSLPI